METNAPSPSPVKRSRFHWKKWLFIALFASLILLCLHTWVALNWSYSTGERAGYVQKLSKKGFLVKTWEGELAMVSMPGTLPEIFHFTIRTDAVADDINSKLGKQVKLTYEEHVGVPSKFFGETQYYVTKVEIIK